MAGAHCSVFSLLLAPSITSRSTHLLLVSSIPSSRHRKNYLRPKILKTLPNPKPILPLLPPPPHPIIICPQSPQEVENPADETQSEDIDAVAIEADRLEELQASEATAAEHNGVSGKLFVTTIFKYGGVYLVGAFVFHTICSVWFLKDYNSNHKDTDLEINENGREKNNFLFNGNGKTGASNVFYAEDQLGMEKKIEEIKLMAREARRIEEMKKEEEEVGDPEINDESPVSSHRLGIEKEIGARLLKLQNRINSNKDSSAALQINSLRNSTKSAGGVARDDNKNVNQGNEALVFKKKLKFRSPSTKPTKTPKGFPGTQDRRASDAKKRDLAGRGTVQVNGSDATDHAQILYEDKQVNQQDVETQENVSSVPLEGRKLVDDKSNAILNHGKNLEEKMETPDMKKKLELKLKTLTMVILMQRGSSGEGQKGLYSLKFTSKEQDQGDDSYTVAFEDHADAKNFCFLLESFFKDLGDFSADAVPMSIQELNEEITSHAKKVVVVKKRQLQLYAGQPLTDVEMALCSIIEQDQNVP